MKLVTYWLDNWEILLAAVSVIVVALHRIWEFIGLPTERKKAEIQARLLEWVREAEASLGRETGKFKLAQVYDLFCSQYPYVKKWFSLEEFDRMVRQALSEMESTFADSAAVKQNALQLK